MGYDLIIIGSGPAGLSAAVYGKRAGLDLLILEQKGMSGGQILNTYEVENYLGLPGINGFDMGMKFREHADQMGAVFKEESVLRIEKMQNGKRVVTDKGAYEAKAVILAPGASHSKLGVPGEDKFSGMGVSYCATCDGAFFRNRTAAVVGGGDVAVEDAIFLARGCEKVYLIHRRDELRAAPILQKRLKELSNVEILWDTIVLEILGSDRVEALALKNVKSGEESQLSVHGVFAAVGIKPNTEVFQGLADMDEKGYFIAEEDCKTSEPGIYAAGDCRTKQLRQIITAVSDGANAVTSVQNYLISGQ